MWRFRNLLLLSLIIFSVVSVAQASSRAENLKKCRLFFRLPLWRQNEIAHRIGATVKDVRWACRVIREEGDGSSHRPRTDAPDSRHSRCHCTIGEVCVRQTLRWACVDQNSSENKCDWDYDCHSPFQRNCRNHRCV